MFAQVSLNYKHNFKDKLKESWIENSASFQVNNKGKWKFSELSW